MRQSCLQKEANLIGPSGHCEKPAATHSTIEQRT
jgi:hypothetical protein